MFCDFVGLKADETKQQKWHLTDGSIIVGELIEDSEDYIIIKTEYGDKKVFKIDLRIINIKIVTKTGSIIIGKFDLSFIILQLFDTIKPYY